MSIIAVKNAFNVTGLKSGEKFVLVALAESHNGKTGRCFPSIKTLAEKTSIGDRQVQRHIDSLKKCGLISVTRKRTSKKWAVNSYAFHWADHTTSEQDHTTSETTSHDMNVVLTGIEPEVELELEVLSERTEPPACAGGQTQVSPETPKTKGEVLVRNFSLKCRKYSDAQLRFYMDCGRHHTNAVHFHKPNNPKRPLKGLQTESLRLWFKALPDSGCAVMNYAMENWPVLRQQWKSEHPSQWNRIQVTPTISALERFGYKELLDSWRVSQQKASLNRVAANLRLQEQAA